MAGKLGRGVPYHAAPTPEIIAELEALGQVGPMPYTQAAAIRRRDQLLVRKAQAQAARAQRELEARKNEKLQG